MPPPQSGKDRQTSLTWWMPANTHNLEHATHLLRDLQQTAIRDVILVFWESDVGYLCTQCRRPATQELFAAMEKVLLDYPVHRVLLAVPKSLILSVRKTIFWSDELSRLLRPLSANWAPMVDVKCSGKPGHDAAITALVVSPDGQWVATASCDSTIIIWDARDACVSQESIAHVGHVQDLAFSPDSRYIASAGQDRTVAVWDISGSAHQVASLSGHVASCSKCAWSSDGAHIASRDGNTVRLWDARTFQLLPLDAPEETGYIEFLFSPDSRWLLIHSGNACGVWDVVSGAYLAFPLQRDCNEEFFLRAAFSPESTHIAVGYDDGMHHVWNVATGQEPLFWQAHENVRAFNVEFSPDGRLLLSAGDKAVKTWDADTGATVQSFEGHESLVTEACFSPCRKYIASASSDETVRV